MTKTSESDLDLASDWALVKQARTTAPAEPKGDVEELESSWRALKNLPDLLYVAREGFGLETMTLFAYRCHGQIKTSKPGQVPDADNWRASFDHVVWMGGAASVHETQTKGQTFTMPKSQVDLTLEAAIERLDKFRLKHIANLRESRTNIEKHIADRQAELARNIERTETAEATTMDALILASIRQKFLWFLQGKIDGTDHLRPRLLAALGTFENVGQVDQERLLGIMMDAVTKAVGNTTVSVVVAENVSDHESTWDRDRRIERPAPQTAVELAVSMGIGNPPRPIYDNGPEIPDYSRGGDGPSAPTCRGCGQMHWNTCPTGSGHEGSEYEWRGTGDHGP